MFTSLEDLTQHASERSAKKIVIAAAEDGFVLEAVNDIEKLGLITPIFVGNREKITAQAKAIGYRLSGKEIIHCEDSEEAAELAVRCISDGEGDIVMKGLISTRTYIRAILNKEYGIADEQVLSHLAVFESPYYHKLLGITDAAMNISPDIGMKREIVQNAVEAFHKLRVKEPKVALLAAVETINPKMPATTDAAALVEEHKKRPLCRCLLDGPLALDLAISAAAAEHKGIHSPVAGDADILVTPDITSGNILYKSLTYLGNARTGSVLLGAQAPVILTSRADSPESKFYSIALAVCLCN